MTSSINRREFLKSSVALGAAAWLTSCVSTKTASVKPRYVSPNSKLNVALIGAGGRAWSHYKYFSQHENIVALCDVDDVRASKMFNSSPNARTFKDFRVMLDKMGREIDAVVVTTPDHTHFAATMAAMELGIHVYVEKPLTHNIWEARTLRKAADYYDVVTIMGNQGHTTEGIRYIKEWYEAGVLGEVREIEAWFHGPTVDGKYFKRPSQFPLPGQRIPATLDWDLWKGPVASDIAYHEDIHPLRWRGYFDFGNGELGDFACHTLDGPNWALTLGSPSSVELIKHDTPFPIHYVPNNTIVKYEFAAKNGRPPVTLKWYDGGLKPVNRPEWGQQSLDTNGMIMIGDKASLMTNARPNSPKLIPNDYWMEFRKNPPAKTIPRVKGGPQKEWAEAIKGNGPKPGSDFEYASELTELTLLGVMAQRFGGRIEWDEKNMRVTNRPELNGYVKEPVRQGWSYGENLWS